MSERGNWLRLACRWWGHVYVVVLDPVAVGRMRLLCLRCHGGGLLDGQVRVEARS